jgi:hypothetical protein
MAENLIPLKRYLSGQDVFQNIGFLQGDQSTILSKLFLKEFRSSISTFKDQSFYAFKLVAYKRIAIEISGTDGLALVPRSPAIFYSWLRIKFIFYLTLSLDRNGMNDLPWMSKKILLPAQDPADDATGQTHHGG